MTTKRDRAPWQAPQDEAHRASRRAREVALQVLYQCEVGCVDPETAMAAYADIDVPGAPPSPETLAQAAHLVIGTLRSLDEIDPLIAASLEHWRPERMAIIDRLILRLSVYQFLHVPALPAGLVMSEAVDLARGFSGEESGRFVNGVLDAIHRKTAPPAAST